ncbi:hypothetical protein NPIL_455471 [Nephila pilipes]|uniref:Uncharacterized protein n=1 Tax=Nephila pilipes TaxID=299642 RepID=A0A8X6JWV0_NEPPI|nr:hypothetical protein NPIL_455471 [Nephila pilipes]
MGKHLTSLMVNRQYAFYFSFHARIDIKHLIQKLEFFLEIGSTGFLRNSFFCASTNICENHYYHEKTWLIIEIKFLILGHH